MADTTFTSAATGRGNIFTGALRAVGQFIVRLTESNHRIRRVEFLNSLSDEELARRGIKRGDIVHHVFKDLYYM